MFQTNVQDGIAEWNSRSGKSERMHTDDMGHTAWNFLAFLIVLVTVQMVKWGKLVRAYVCVKGRYFEQHNPKGSLQLKLIKIFGGNVSQERHIKLTIWPQFWSFVR